MSEETDTNSALQKVIESLWVRDVDLSILKPITVSVESARAFIASDYTIINIEDTPEVALPQNLHLSPYFLELVKQGQSKFGKAVCEEVFSGRSIQFPGPITNRTKMLIQCLEGSPKRTISAFSGDFVTVDSSLGRDWYIYGEGEDFCLISEFGSPMHASHFESTWVFPKRKTILLNRSGFADQLVLENIATLFTRIASNIKDVKNYLNQTNRNIMLCDFPSPHLSHYIWNVLAGWSNVLTLAKPQKQFGIYSYPNQNFFGRVYDFFRGQIPSDLLALELGDNELFLHSITNNTFILCVKEEFITADLAKQMVDYSRNKCDPSFLECVEDFKKGGGPIVIFGLRLDNRKWIEQEDGWVELARHLKQRYPEIRIVIDGLAVDSVKGWTTGWMSVDEELALAKAIASKLVDDVPVFVGVALKFCENVILCDSADFFVSPSGSGMALYKWISNKPGVAFSNKTVLNPVKIWWPLRVWDAYREGIIAADYLTPDKVEDIETHRNHFSRNDFSMRWEDLAEAVDHSLSAHGWAKQC